jgi:small GTP-binding protein
MTRLGITLIDDEMGAIPSGSKILLSVAPGIDPTPLGVSVAVASAQGGARSIYLTNNKPGGAVRRELDNIMPGDACGSDLRILDAFSAMIGIYGEGDEMVQLPFDMSHVVARISDASDGKDATLVIDNISTMLDVLGIGRIKKMISSLPKEMRTVALFSNWSYDKVTVESLTDIFDAIIDVKNVERVTVQNQMMRLRRVNWGATRQLSVPIKVLRPGGLRVYVPKILITGPYSAGKSTMTRAISTQSVSVDRMGTTVAMDHGYLDYGGIAAEVYGTPGQEMFDPLLDYLADEAVGIILVVDSSSPDTFERAREMLEKSRALNLPLVVAANHSDSPKTVDREVIRAVLKLPDSIPIVKTVASRKKGIKELLDKLMKQIIEVV